MLYFLPELLPLEPRTLLPPPTAVLLTSEPGYRTSCEEATWYPASTGSHPPTHVPPIFQTTQARDKHHSPRQIRAHKTTLHTAPRASSPEPEISSSPVSAISAAYSAKRTECEECFPWARSPTLLPARAPACRRAPGPRGSRRTCSRNSGTSRRSGPWVSGHTWKQRFRRVHWLVLRSACGRALLRRGSTPRCFACACTAIRRGEVYTLRPVVGVMLFL
jgi:hypothetical protein